jgi:hypothetical protein
MLPTQPRARSIFLDPSLWLLIASNVIAMVVALKEGWNVSTLMWVYLLQSLIIGFFNFVRIMKLQHFSTEGLLVNGKPVEPTTFIKWQVAFTFLFTYTFFHVVFAFLIYQLHPVFGTPNVEEFRWIVGTVLLFFASHFFSSLYNHPREEGVQKIGTIMAYPYFRILPMHLTFFIAASGIAALPVFLVVRAIADVLMHVVMHEKFRNVAKK